ncbi:MAG TPA: phosphatase PAP2 family protein [Planctomycetota bacterium]
MHAVAARRSRALTLLFPAFCGLNIALLLLSPGLVPEPGRAVATWVVLGTGAWLAGRAARAVPFLAPALLVLGATALLFACYSALSGVISWVNPEDREWWALALDRRWFGYSWEGAWSGIANPWLSDGLQLVYTSFYGFPLLLGIALAKRSDWDGVYSALDRAILGFLLSYAGYLLVPMRSPYAFVEYAADLPSFGLQHWLHERLVEQSWTTRDCFPSGHTMLSCFVAWMAWVRARRVFWVLGPWAALTVVATLYLRYHYLVDVIAGLLAFLLLIPLTNWVFGPWRWPDAGPGGEEAAVPPCARSGAAVGLAGGGSEQ